MSLQPLVENAFNYAIEPLGRDAVICVYTEDGDQDDRIWLCVQDFGKGISKEKQKELYLEQKKSGTIVKPHKIGRNDPCPCGSGKKYKLCCGR